MKNSVLLIDTRMLESLTLSHAMQETLKVLRFRRLHQMIL